MFVFDAHFPVPLLGRVPAAEALALAAPYGRPALVPGDWRLITNTVVRAEKLPLVCTWGKRYARIYSGIPRAALLCTACCAGSGSLGLSLTLCLPGSVLHIFSVGSPSIVAAQLVSSTAGAGFAVFAKAPSVLWPVPLHEELVRALRIQACDVHSTYNNVPLACCGASILCIRSILLAQGRALLGSAGGAVLQVRHGLGDLAAWLGSCAGMLYSWKLCSQGQREFCHKAVP